MTGTTTLAKATALAGTVLALAVIDSRVAEAARTPTVQAKALRSAIASPRHIVADGAAWPADPDRRPKRRREGRCRPPRSRRRRALDGAVFDSDLDGDLDAIWPT